jgi:hypothetical protein
VDKGYWCAEIAVMHTEFFAVKIRRKACGIGKTGKGA